MLVGSLHEDLGEDLGAWTHVNSTLIRRFSVAHANFPPILIGLLSVSIAQNLSISFTKKGVICTKYIVKYVSSME